MQTLNLSVCKKHNFYSHLLSLYDITTNTHGCPSINSLFTDGFVHLDSEWFIVHYLFIVEGLDGVY